MEPGNDTLENPQLLPITKQSPVSSLMQTGAVLIVDIFSSLMSQLDDHDVVLIVIHKFVADSKLTKILVSLGVLILHFIIMIAFYEMPEFERITDPYQPELADRSYNLTFCLSDYQEHSFDSCPGKSWLANQI